MAIAGHSRRPAVPLCAVASGPPSCRPWPLPLGARACGLYFFFRFRRFCGASRVGSAMAPPPNPAGVARPKRKKNKVHSPCAPSRPQPRPSLRVPIRSVLASRRGGGNALLAPWSGAYIYIYKEALSLCEPSLNTLRTSYAHLTHIALAIVPSSSMGRGSNVRGIAGWKSRRVALQGGGVRGLVRGIVRGLAGWKSRRVALQGGGVRGFVRGFAGWIR